jgi:hypothetical protein
MTIIFWLLESILFSGVVLSSIDIFSSGGIITFGIDFDIMGSRTPALLDFFDFFLITIDYVYSCSLLINSNGVGISFKD